MGLSKTIQYRKHTIRPIAVGLWRYCEIQSPDGRPFGETETYPNISMAVREAKKLILENAKAMRDAYFSSSS